MCNREISSRRIDCFFFRAALRPSGTDRQGGGSVFELCVYDRFISIIKLMELRHGIKQLNHSQEEKSVKRLAVNPPPSTGNGGEIRKTGEG